MEHAVSRRSFLKGVGLAGGAVGAGMLLNGCASGGESAGEATPWWAPELWDIETDVIVVGTGDAGAPAAIRAVDAGAEVVMIDKGEFFGGCSVLGGGNCQLACTSVQERLGIEDKPEWAFEDQMEFGLHRSNPEVLQAWIDTSDEYAKWVEDVCGGEWVDVTKQEPARVPRSHQIAEHKGQPQGSGVVFSMLFHEQLEARGVQILLEHKMTKLYREPGGPVLGLKVETPDGTINMKARKGVVIATGGFKGNPRMIRAQHAAFDETLIWTGWPDVLPTGDGHLCVMDAGGGCVDMSFIMEFSGRLGSRQYVRWDRPHFDNPSTKTGLPSGKLDHMVFVQNQGTRYLNEAGWEAGHTLPWLPHMIAFLQIEGRPRMEWFVTDQAGAVDAGWDKFEDSFTSPDPENTPCCEPGWVAKADTIAELAEQMGVPVDNLEATIAQYNEYAAAGEDPDFGRPGPLYPVAEPPFWAARWCRMPHDQCTGIRVNQNMQVVDQSFQWQPEGCDSVAISEEPVIPHLYAAGECTGGTGGAVRGSGKRGWYQVHGYIAGDMVGKEEPIA
ncbi:FAD-dependent oxidoreductase [Raoultibacter phocaeensis]|uniref:FAD-dependent oxidoreductase n=1 Tax=Raoultibacter phocaeensis TaxID=2479841 RepID=UPI001119662D|nr:FAD-dependent oxidoreductase [Raoultibacter phocaeensis]